MPKKWIVCFTLILFALVITGCGQVYTNTDDYQEYLDSIPGSNAFMPVLTDIPAFQTCEIYYYDRLGQSINLVITYSDETYETAKETVLGSYLFLQTPLVENDYYLIPETEFEYESFTIKVVDDDNFDYPEQFGMIGYSDANHQISFLFFFDDSLSQLSDNSGRMTRFIEKEFWFPEDN
ncbi:MAG: hypothetical protein WC509_06530 [Candidatus Izemoplasmatales bacterium]